jgi:2'-5' RNA ligase
LPWAGFLGAGGEDYGDAADLRGVRTAWEFRAKPGKQVCLPHGKRSLAGMPGLIPDAGPGWETILLLPVPAAEPAVSCHRARLVESARLGVPAHLTVLYPFLPPAEISEPLLASLRRLFARFTAFEFTLDRVGWFGDEVVWLGPSDPAPFLALASAACTSFPSCLPYGGQHAGLRQPHLTIGKGGGQQALRAAESVRPCLPIEATAAEIVLMAGPRPGTPGTPPGQWRTVAAFPLG